MGHPQKSGPDTCKSRTHLGTQRQRPGSPDAIPDTLRCPGRGTHMYGCVQRHTCMESSHIHTTPSMIRLAHPLHLFNTQTCVHSTPVTLLPRSLHTRHILALLTPTHTFHHQTYTDRLIVGEERCWVNKTECPSGNALVSQVCCNKMPHVGWLK